jgi:hypothetical protein
MYRLIVVMRVAEYHDAVFPEGRLKSTANVLQQALVRRTMAVCRQPDRLARTPAHQFLDGRRVTGAEPDEAITLSVAPNDHFDSLRDNP